MRLLLDTHIAYWLTLDPARLSDFERDAIASTAHTIAFSAISIWELRLKWDSFHRSGQRNGPANPSAVLAALKGIECEEIRLSAEDAATTLQVALRHKDPFDELILAQAQAHGMRLLTRDSRLADHPLALIG